MKAFITNFQSPKELDELIERYELNGLTNLDLLLQYKDADPDERIVEEWTTWKDSRPGDIALFMCAKTSKDHMGHVCAEARRLGDKSIIDYSEKERELYKQYAGKIVAVGVVNGEPFQDVSIYEFQSWKSPWYASISSIELLDTPISIDDFRSFITVSRTGAITVLTEEQKTQLLAIVAGENPYLSF